MNELSRIQFESAQEHPDYVSGRVLHQALEIKTPYRKWFPRVCVQNGYEEGQDYMTSVKKVRRADGAPMPYDLHDHWLTLDAAKEICLTQHTAIGRLLRRKFIARQQAISESQERELRSCQNQLARTVQEKEELSASLTAQEKDMAAMGALIERANATLILQRDALNKQRRKVDDLNGKVARQNKFLQEMAPKADYYDHVLDAPDTYSTTTLAKSCGLTARELNRFLHEQKVQYRLHDGSVSSSAVQPLSFSPMIHAYPYDRPQGRLFLFFNESSRESSAFTGVLEGVSSPVLYDPEAEKCFSPQGEATARGYRVSLTLSPGQLVILTQPLPQLPKAEQARKLLEGKSLTPCWRVSFPDAPEMQDFHTSQLFDIASCFPRFAGTVRYEAEVTADCACFGLRIKNQFDAARVWVDGREAGMRMSPPYDFFLSLSPGRHTITIETVNAPVYRWRDPLSIHGWLPPVGLLGPVVLLTDASAGS